MRGIQVLLFAISMMASIAHAQRLEFSLHQHRGERTGPTLLVIGGIQGDEPGGFNAASLLVTNYTITHGQVWVVPNLNFESIVHRSRGIHGDMNRKFLRVREADPEYAQIQNAIESTVGCMEGGLQRQYEGIARILMS